jgi:hypothetical protein
MIKPRVIKHNNILVVRDDLFPGGTKARFLPLLFTGADEVVYASPAEGSAQTALATVAKQLGKRATIFVAERTNPHDRQVPYGYLSTVQKRAEEYSTAIRPVHA